MRSAPLLRALLPAVAFVSLMLSPTPVAGTTLYIDPTQSIVRTTHWSNWPWDLEPPHDAVDLSISGSFEILVERRAGQPDYPYLARLQDIDVEIFHDAGRTWEFPDFLGLLFADQTIGASENVCAQLFWYLSGPGSCWSQGNFGSYWGTYDGSVLTITGGKNPNFFNGTNGFFYEIVARVEAPDVHAVPEPSAVVLLGLGLLIAVGNVRSLRRTILRSGSRWSSKDIIA